MKKPVLRVIKGGRKDDDPKTVRTDFDIAAFMQSETIDTSNFSPVDPSLYGKTINGVTYPEPVSEIELYLLNQQKKSDPDFVP